MHLQMIEARVVDNATKILRCKIFIFEYYRYSFLFFLITFDSSKDVNIVFLSLISNGELDRKFQFVHVERKTNEIFQIQMVW